MGFVVNFPAMFSMSWKRRPDKRRWPTPKPLGQRLVDSGSGRPGERRYPQGAFSKRSRSRPRRLVSLGIGEHHFRGTLGWPRWFLRGAQVGAVPGRLHEDQLAV